MKKEVIFFTETPPDDKTAIHVWLGQSTLPHQKLLKQFLKLYLGTSPSRLAKNPNGKLYLPRSPLHFNLSDCDEWTAIAFSWEGPIGIDIETIRPIEEIEQILLDHFSAKERDYINSSATHRCERFWEIWNRKEACFKALGLGLQDNMQEWDCSGEGWIFVDKVWVRSLPLRGNLSTAIAIQI